MRITQSTVQQLFDYDQTTGWLTWKIRKARRIHIGDRAGHAYYQSRNRSIPSCRSVIIDKVVYQEHDIIWLWMTGKRPSVTIDHIDTNPHNNAWRNLREATYNNNAHNQRGRRPGKLKWVYFDKITGRYFSEVRCNYVSHYAGRFDTEQEAHNAAYELAKQLHGPFVRRA